MPEFGPLALLVLMLVVFTAINPAFMSLTNVSNALTFTVELGLMALAMTLLMTSGEFDLSVGSVFGFAPVVMWALFNAGTMSLFPAFLIAIGVALCIGFVNGVFVTRLGIPSFLVTLGMLLVVRGSALWLTSGFPQRTWDAGEEWLSVLLVGDFYVGGLRIYMSLIWFILIAHRLPSRADAHPLRQLDPGDRRQRQCRAQPRRADQARQARSCSCCPRRWRRRPASSRRSASRPRTPTPAWATSSRSSPWW